MLNEKFDLPNTFATSFNPLCVGNPGPVKLSGTRKVIHLGVLGYKLVFYTIYS